MGETLWLFFYFIFFLNILLLALTTVSKSTHVNNEINNTQQKVQVYLYEFSCSLSSFTT